MRKIFFFILGFGVFISSCTDPPFPGYSETPNGLLYKLNDIGEGDRHARPGDYVTAQIVIKSEKDSVLFDTYKMGLDGAVTFILPEPEYAKDYREGYMYLNEGDRATFVTDAEAVFVKRNKSVIPKGMKANSPVFVETKVLKIKTAAEHEAELMEDRKRLEQGEFEEKKILEKYIAEAGIMEQPVANGMYYIRLVEGKGITPDSARIVLINYKGCFLNGRCFDMTFESQPFEYVLGAEEQLIPGLVAGVRHMREGEKAKFIIPSHLAFGSMGSSTGMVPPFTTVIYEVELLKVQ